MSELHLRRRLRIVVGGEFRHRLVAAKHCPGPQQAGERLELSVVGPRRLDVVPPRRRDAGLSALKLRLQRQEVLVRLEVGIFFADREQAAKRARQLVLGVLELLELIGISELGGIDPDLRCFSPRFHHGGQHVLLLFGVALHGGDEVGD